MKTLKTNETFLNDTKEDIFYIVEYFNFLGQKQTQREILSPLQSITKTSPLNTVKIIFKP